MGRGRRLNYGLVVGLYEGNYGQIAIGKILETPHGHISKVLRKEGVETRKRGEIVEPLPFNELPKMVQECIKADSQVLSNYEKVMGVSVVEEVQEVQLNWKEMNREEKVEVIFSKLDKGMTTREAAKEIGIAQSTLVKTKNKYLKEQEEIVK